MRRFLPVLLLVLSISSPLALWGQQDTSQSTMSFDLGWTRNRNIHLWPVFKRTLSATESDLQIVFPLVRHREWKMKGVHNTRFLPFFIQEKDSSTKDLRLGSMYYPSLLRIKRDTLDGYRSFRFLELYDGLGLLGWSRSQQGMRVDNNFLFVYLYRKDRLSDRSHLLLLPLYWQVRNRQSNFLLIIPAYGRFLSKDSVQTTMVTPLFWHTRKKEYSSSFVFPLYSQSKSPRHSLIQVWPLFSYKRTVKSDDSVFYHRTNNLNALLLFKKEVDWQQYKQGRNTCKTVDSSDWVRTFRHNTRLFPLIWWRRSSKYRNDTLIDTSQTQVIFPLYWQWNNPRWRALFVIPFYGRYTSSDSLQVSMISPLFWKWKEGKTSNTLLLPFYWKTKAPDHSLVQSWPLFKFEQEDKQTDTTSHLQYKRWTVLLLLHKEESWHRYQYKPYQQRRAGDTLLQDLVRIYNYEYNAGMIPFVWWNKHVRYENDTLADSVQTKMFLGLYWNVKKTERNDSVFQKSATKILFPVYWDIRNSRHRTFSIQPFFSIGRAADSTRGHLSITPLFWRTYHRTTELVETNNAIFPLWWQGKEVHTLPRYSYTRSHHVLFPLYWHYGYASQRGRTTQSHVFFPLLWYSRERDSSSVEHSRLVVFPFVWSKRIPSRHLFSVLPFFLTRKDTANKRALTMLTPLFWHTKSREGTRCVVFPLWWSYREYSKAQWKNKYSVLFPLYWHFQRRTYNFKTWQPEVVQRRVLFPFYWSRTGPTDTTITIFPLYFHRHAQGVTKRNFGGVLFRHEQSTSHTKWSFLWPLVGRQHNDNGLYYHVMPLVWRRKEDSLRYLAIAPFYYHRKSPTTETYRLLWDLATFRTIKEVKRHRSFLWKTVFWERYANGDHTFRILYRLYAHVNRNGAFERSALPLYRISYDTLGNKSQSYLFNFYTRSQKPILNSKEYYKEVRIFWFMRLFSNYAYLKRKGLADSVKRRRR